MLRLFRRATAAERKIVQVIADELRPVSYLAAGTLQRSLDLVGRMSRNEFDGLLDAMVRAGLIDMEEAEFEKNGEVIRFRKVRLTDAGLEVRPMTPLPLLIGDGIADEFDPGSATPPRKKNVKIAAQGRAKSEISPPAPIPDWEALAERLREWRTVEARRLGVPAFVVLHDRTLSAVALARPENRMQLLAIDGIGPAKAERFGEAILTLCAGPAS